MCLYPVMGLPWWLSGKDPPANAGDVGLIPGLEDHLEKEIATHFSILGEGNGNPFWYSCLENPMDREALRAVLFKGSQRVGRN